MNMEDCLSEVLGNLTISSKKRVRFSERDDSNRYYKQKKIECRRKRRKVTAETKLKLYCLFGTDSEDESDSEDRETIFIFEEPNLSVDSLVDAFKPLGLNEC